MLPAPPVTRHRLPTNASVNLACVIHFSSIVALPGTSLDEVQNGFGCSHPSVVSRQYMTALARRKCDTILRYTFILETPVTRRRSTVGTSTARYPLSKA